MEEIETAEQIIERLIDNHVISGKEATVLLKAINNGNSYPFYPSYPIVCPGTQPYVPGTVYCSTTDGKLKTKNGYGYVEC